MKIKQDIHVRMVSICNSEENKINIESQISQSANLPLTSSCDALESRREDCSCPTRGCHHFLIQWTAIPVKQQLLCSPVKAIISKYSLASDQAHSQQSSNASMFDHVCSWWFLSWAISSTDTTELVEKNFFIHCNLNQKVKFKITSLISSWFVFSSDMGCFRRRCSSFITLWGFSNHAKLSPLAIELHNISTYRRNKNLRCHFNETLRNISNLIRAVFSGSQFYGKIGGVVKHGAR